MEADELRGRGADVWPRLIGIARRWSDLAELIELHVAKSNEQRQVFREEASDEADELSRRDLVHNLREHHHQRPFLTRMPMCSSAALRLVSMHGHGVLALERWMTNEAFEEKAPEGEDVRPTIEAAVAGCLLRRHVPRGRDAVARQQLDRA